MGDSRTHLFSNNASAVMASNLPVGGLALVLATGKGALFPAPAPDEIFVITIENPSQGVHEICYCVARLDDTLIVERGCEGTLEREWPQDSGNIVQHRVTAGTLEYLADSGGGGGGGFPPQLGHIGWV